MFSYYTERNNNHDKSREFLLDYTRLVPFDATSATSGFCVHIKDVAYVNASFHLTITDKINEKKNNQKIGFGPIFPDELKKKYVNLSKIAFTDARGTLTQKVERKNILARRRAIFN